MINIRIARKLSLVSLLLLASCSPYLAGTIDVPEIPRPPTANIPFAPKLDLAVAMEGFSDARPEVPASQPNVKSQYVEPYGDVVGTVEQAVMRAFRTRGLVFSNKSWVTIRGDIRQWRSKVVTTTAAAISSEALLYVEVLDRSGGKIYSGTYSGTRSSQFPFVAKEDIQDSLAIAMSQAVDHLLADEDLLRALWWRTTPKVR